MDVVYCIDCVVGVDCCGVCVDECYVEFVGGEVECVDVWL